MKLKETTRACVLERLFMCAGTFHGPGLFIYPNGDFLDGVCVRALVGVREQACFSVCM